MEQTKTTTPKSAPLPNSDECECKGKGYVLFYLNGMRQKACDCPAGVQYQAEKDEERRKMLLKRAQKYLDNANIPDRFYPYTFDTYPVSNIDKPAIEKIKDWVLGMEQDEETFYDWHDNRKDGLFIHGGFGTGKTGLAVAVIKEFIRIMCNPALFMTTPDLLDAIRREYNETPEEGGILEKCKAVDLLVLDDIGAERTTDWVTEKLFQLINHRHDWKMDTVFTSNLTLTQLAKHIGERTTWRIAEMCESIELKGKNLREKKK